MATSNELFYYNVLRLIAKDFKSPDKIRSKIGVRQRVNADAAIEYAYKDVIELARKAIEGKRRPRINVK